MLDIETNNLFSRFCTDQQEDKKPTNLLDLLPQKIIIYTQEELKTDINMNICIIIFIQILFIIAKREKQLKGRFIDE